MCTVFMPISNDFWCTLYNLLKILKIFQYYAGKILDAFGNHAQNYAGTSLASAHDKYLFHYSDLNYFEVYLFPTDSTLLA